MFSAIRGLGTRIVSKVRKPKQPTPAKPTPPTQNGKSLQQQQNGTARKNDPDTPDRPNGAKKDGGDGMMSNGMYVAALVGLPLIGSLFGGGGGGGEQAGANGQPAAGGAGQGGAGDPLSAVASQPKLMYGISSASSASSMSALCLVLLIALM